MIVVDSKRVHDGQSRGDNGENSTVQVLGWALWCVLRASFLEKKSGQASRQDCCEIGCGNWVVQNN